MLETEEQGLSDNASKLATCKPPESRVCCKECHSLLFSQWCMTAFADDLATSACRSDCHLAPVAIIAQAMPLKLGLSVFSVSAPIARVLGNTPMGLASAESPIWRVCHQIVTDWCSWPTSSGNLLARPTRGICVGCTADALPTKGYHAYSMRCQPF